MDDEECIENVGEMLNLSRAATREWVARLWVITLEILHVPAVWAAIQAVAKELFSRTSLTWDEVCTLVDEAMRTCAQPDQGLTRCTREIQRLSPRLARRG
jgi:hypothetical protein